MHSMIGRLGPKILVDLHHGRILVRRRETHSLTELVVLIETSLTSLDNHTTTGDQVTDSVTTNSHSTDAETDNLQKTAAT